MCTAVESFIILRTTPILLRFDREKFALRQSVGREETPPSSSSELLLRVCDTVSPSKLLDLNSGNKMGVKNRRESQGNNVSLRILRMGAAAASVKF